MSGLNRIKDERLLKVRLEELYSEYNRREYVAPDPLQFLYDFEDVRDREVVGIVASSLAFGNVVQINKSISRVIDALTDGGRLKPSVAVFSSVEEMPRRLKGFRHRWVTDEDVVGLLEATGRIMEKYGSIEGCFTHHVKETKGDMRAGIDGLIVEMRDGDGRNAGRLLPRAGGSSACKRLNLFLRWMVRCDEVDPGGWKEVGTEMLLYPVDTHIRYLAERLGMTSRRSVSHRMAVEITEAFRVISPGDPVKYDFVLTRFGIRDDLRTDDLIRVLTA